MICDGVRGEKTVRSIQEGVVVSQEAIEKLAECGTFCIEKGKCLGGIDNECLEEKGKCLGEIEEKESPLGVNG